MEFHLRSSKPSLNSLNLFNLLSLLETCLFFEYDEQRTVHRFFRQGAPSSRLSLSLRIQCKLAEERANCTDLTNHLWKKQTSASGESSVAASRKWLATLVCLHRTKSRLLSLAKRDGLPGNISWYCQCPQLPSRVHARREYKPWATYWPIGSGIRQWYRNEFSYLHRQSQWSLPYAILTSTDRATAVEWGKKSHPRFLLLDAIVENRKNSTVNLSWV